MVNKLAAALREHCGVARGAHITAALSGGIDSVVLTYALRELAKQGEITLSAVHIHHGLRAASDGEETFVRELCKAWGIELAVHHLSLGAKPREAGESLEMQARDARYAVFARYTGEGRYVATAHQLDDCIETFLIHACRGSGSKGLSAIPYRRDGIIRPMLDVDGREIAAFAAAHNLSWVEDESNRDSYFLRNFLRTEVLPLLDARQDINARKGLARTLANLREENELLEQLAAVSSDKLPPRPLAWRRWKAECPALTAQRFDVLYARLAAGEQNFREQLAGELFCIVQNGQVAFKALAPDQPIPKALLADGLTLADGRQIILKEINTEFTNLDIDCAKIKNTPLYIRSRREGDRIRLRARPAKSIKKLFSEHKVTERARRLLVTDSTDAVLWAEGFGSDESVAPDEYTTRAWRITLKTGEE